MDAVEVHNLHSSKALTGECGATLWPKIRSGFYLFSSQKNRASVLGRKLYSIVTEDLQSTRALE